MFCLAHNKRYEEKFLGGLKEAIIRIEFLRAHQLLWALARENLPARSYSHLKSLELYFVSSAVEVLGYDDVCRPVLRIVRTSRVSSISKNEF